MNLESYVLTAGISIIFSIGVAYGVVKATINALQKDIARVESASDKADTNAEKNIAEFKKKVGLFMENSCEARMKSQNEYFRRILFDDDALPKFMPIKQCEKTHAELKKYIEEVGKKIDAQNGTVAGLLKKILAEVGKKE